MTLLEKLQAYNKALILAAGLIVFFLVQAGVLVEGQITQDKIEMIVVTITTILASFIPNKKKVDGEMTNVNEIDKKVKEAKAKR